MSRLHYAILVFFKQCKCHNMYWFGISTIAKNIAHVLAKHNYKMHNNYDSKYLKLLKHCNGKKAKRYKMTKYAKTL